MLPGRYFRFVEALLRASRRRTLLYDDADLAAKPSGRGGRSLAGSGPRPGRHRLSDCLSRGSGAAQPLLELTDQPIEHIAQETGLGNAAAMRARFGRWLRTTPTARRHRFTNRAG
jgi:AraC-like DNA-binding protein